MALLLKNNAYSKLAASLTDIATSLTVTTGHGNRFPIAANPDYFKITLQDAANNIEIVKVTERANNADTMTIQRAQEGTVARAWNIDDIVELRITAGISAPLGVLAEAATAANIRTAIGAFASAGGSISGNTDITGNLGITGNLSYTGTLTGASGTAGAPSFVPSGDTNTGIFFPAADTWAVATAGSERFRIDPAGNGGLGVTPSAWATNFKVLEFANGCSIGATVSGLNNISVANAYNNGTNWIYKTTEGASYFNNTGGEFAWFTAPSGTAGNPITFTQAMTLTQGGNLLVGTTVDGGKKLMLGGSTDVGFINNANTSTTLFEVGLLGGANDATGFVYNRANSPVVFGTNNTERARITSAGYFKASNTGTYGGVAGIGSLVASTQHIFQSNQNASTLVVINENVGTSTINYDSALATGSAGFHFAALTNAVRVYQVLANGNVQNTNNSYGAISDAKLKENVTDAPSYLDKFMQVRFRKYNLIGDTLTQFGVIAQELETVFPGLVDTTPDMKEVTRTRTVDVPAVEEVRDEKGVLVTPAQPATTREEEYTESVPTGTVTKSVKYSVLAQMQGKVIQEQQAIIEQQQTVLADLLARVAALEAK